MPRVSDDATFQPVIANGRVYFGSSADDHLYCLNSATGQELWSFCSDGPIRFAPFVTDDGVYVGSDDGKLYCLNPRNGKVRWSRRIADEDRRISGNGRLISAWPVRTGCVVQDGSVFATAGLFPQQGTWAVSLDATSGELHWKQTLDASPQGYSLASDEMLYVPTGRGNPIALDLSTGQIRKQFNGVGGTFAVVSDGALLAGRGNDGTLELSEVEVS
jgi:outer membrane protein assembly factor BamB